VVSWSDPSKFGLGATTGTSDYKKKKKKKKKKKEAGILFALQFYVQVSSFLGQLLENKMRLLKERFQD